MAHTFLMQAGRWTLQGNWLERNGMPITVKGKILVAWNRDDWFTMVTKLIFPGADREEIAFQYRGRMDAGERQYTFVLQHSLLGRVEGEGWLAPESIVQRYWVLGDRQRRSGFETLYRMDDNTYYLSSGIMAGHYLSSTMEATLERQPEQ
ncbi:hypothetical protein K9N68_04915 [Kovacikia minuta CCNUW1]|uniref:hypothetical protein n=1 Tax=Kovacikia minuta TaxID=2931930 RepID=UPI001CCEDB4C|nr:hypothetical protein [Kovacikia minuta]UBF27302.1 hypothetical protein K9N68_04915 [Kovacikia minuta CCNUW1]